MSPKTMILAFNLDSPGHYLKVGSIQIAVSNLIVIGLMIVVFVLAILLPFPRGKR